LNATDDSIEISGEQSEEEEGEDKARDLTNRSIVPFLSQKK